MKNKVNTTILVNDNIINILRIGDIDYISLTDLAKYSNSKDPSFIVKNWLRLINSINYIGLWETLNNQNFNLVEFHQIKMQYGVNSFSMSPTQWIKRTNAIGIKSGAGKYSMGTFAHPDIAFEFASWLNPEFKLYLITEFQRLKKNETRLNNFSWSVRRELAKTNYLIHTEAIKDNIIPLLTSKQKIFVYANEADVINVALFGITAREWKDKNQNIDGNIRDYASILQLVVLANLENLNANMIENNISQQERLLKLNLIAKRQLKILSPNKLEKIKEIN